MGKNILLRFRVVGESVVRMDVLHEGQWMPFDCRGMYEDIRKTTEKHGYVPVLNHEQQYRRFRKVVA